MAIVLVAPPTVAKVRNWCQVSTDSISDEDLDMVLGAEQELQETQCRIPADAGGRIPRWAYQALLRRCARELAARGVPLGMTAEGEYGSSRLPSFDGEIARLEGPFRKQVAG